MNKRLVKQALYNARSLLQSFGGQLTLYTEAEARSQGRDMVMWQVQHDVEAALEEVDR